MTSARYISLSITFVSCVAAFLYFTLQPTQHFPKAAGDKNTASPSNMTMDTYNFTPELLLSAPRRGPAVPDPTGQKAIYTVSTYSFEEHKKNVEIRVLNLSNGKSSLVTNEEKTSEPNWLEDSTELLWLKGGDKGVTQLVIGNVAEVGQNYVAGIIPGGISNVKLKNLSPGRIAIAVTGKARPNGTLYNKEDEPKKYTTARVYDSTIVRHWDEYVVDKNSIWYGVLEKSTGQWSLGSLTNALKGTNLESPIPTFGERDNFDISASGIIFVARDTNLNPAFNTKCNFYHISLSDFSSPPSGAPQQIGIEKLQGAATSPVYSPDGKSAVYLQMKKNGYDSDKNYVVLISLLDGALDSLGLSSSAELLELKDGQSEWDVSPSAVTWTSDGKTLLLQGQADANKVLYKLDLSESRLPVRLTGDGAVSDAQPLKGGSTKVLVSSSSLIDNSIYTVIDLSQPESTSKISSNSRDGLSFGLSSDQVADIRFQGAGNYQVHALVVKPSNFSEIEKYPLAYLVHGGPQVSWQPRPIGRACSRSLTPGTGSLDSLLVYSVEPRSFRRTRLCGRLAQSDWKHRLRPRIRGCHQRIMGRIALSRSCSWF